MYNWQNSLCELSFACYISRYRYEWMNVIIYKEMEWISYIPTLSFTRHHSFTWSLTHSFIHLMIGLSLPATHDFFPHSAPHYLSPVHSFPGVISRRSVNFNSDLSPDSPGNLIPFNQLLGTSWDDVVVVVVAIVVVVVVVVVVIINVNVFIITIIIVIIIVVVIINNNVTVIIIKIYNCSNSLRESFFHSVH